LRHSVEGIQKWRNRAIFVDFRKTRISFDEEEGSRKRRNVPDNFLEKPLSKMKHPEKAMVRRLSTAELLSGAFAILSFVVFVYIKMLELEIQSQNSISQLETYSVISIMVGIAFLITFASSMILRRVFPGEM